MTTNKKHVTMYTDGACKGNPGVGGWGVKLQYGEHVKELFGGEVETTNNRMEMTAVIAGLKVLKQSCVVTVYTDSKYVLQGMEEWLEGWKARGWKTASKAAVKNVDLWQQLDDLVQQHEVSWQWVKGHAGNAGNERADELANMGVASVLVPDGD
ncbi:MULTISPECIES: ribonuclease HI [Vitreoscilla]|uniref:Ribonuclease H n=1 Tax=Vitreoscilla stercoraria TaxID=61 RepID=A0ABY4E7J8_VITST|nr:MULTISPECIES: ribonuclease HI [Vitreoscilla]AUZ04552.2 ribonuclease H [Vitreoscilla sp. C1]UOO91741.1 ribonuclease HI [Vitreoscilla stercoraria]